MQKELEGMKNMTILPEKLTIRSALDAGRAAELDAFADQIAASVNG